MKQAIQGFIFTACTLIVTIAPVCDKRAQAAAQEPGQFDQAIFDTGTQNSGAILQDRDGFLWIGTNGAGLFRYDGYELKAYKPGGPNSLSSPYVYALYEDRDGLLWIGTGGGGLDRYDKETNAFTHYKHDPQNPQSISSDAVEFTNLQTIREDREGKLWIGTQNGLNVLDKATGTFKHYFHNPSDPNSLSHDNISALLFDQQGILWIGTKGGGLNRFDPQAGTFTRYTPDPMNPQKLGGEWVVSLAQDDKGMLWVATVDNGLYKLDCATGIFTPYFHDSQDPNSLRGNKIASMYRDISGVLWIVYLNSDQLGLSVFDPRTKTFTHVTHDPENVSSLSSTSISSAYQDRAGIVWIVNNTGLVDKLDSRKPRFRLYRHDPKNPKSLNSNVIVPILEDRQGQIWIGTDVGLEMYDKQADAFVEYVQGYYSGLYEDKAGTLWLGGGGIVPTSLYIFDRDTRKMIKSFTHDPQNPKSLVNSRQIFGIIGDNQDSDVLWMATTDAGLEKFQKSTETFTHYQHDPQNPNSLSNNSLLTALCQDKQGILWIPTNGGGLDRFDPRAGTFTHFRHDPQSPTSLSADTVNVVFEDATGMLWVGTAAGFDKFDRKTQTFKRYTKDTGYPVSMIASINQDADGNLWMGSLGGDGLIKFDPKTEVLRVYKESDGLQGNVFYPLNGIRDRDGMMWFGGSNGLNIFYPQDIQDNTYIPPVVLTALKQGGEPLQSGKSPERVHEITMDWQHNFFEFEYAALNFTQASKNQYTYKLEGFDKDWFSAGTRRFGRYSGLPSGHYSLHIIGSNNDGIWNAEGVALQVIVVPPFWQTWWFRGGLGLLVLGLVGGGVAWRIRVGEVQRQRLEILVDERTRALAESNAQLTLAKEQAEAANRAKSEFLSKMSHELRTPLNSILGYAQILQRESGVTTRQADGLRIIHQSGNHLLTLINDILDLAKIEAGKLELAPLPFHLPNFLHSIAGIIHMRADQKALAFAYEPLTPIPSGVQADEKRLRQVLLNLLGNAVKFTDHGQVTLHVRVLEEFTSAAGTPHVKLRFEVADTGTGIAPEHIERIFQPFEQVGDAAHRAEGTGLGLTISRQLVEAMGSQLVVTSQVGVGSTFGFEVSFPVVTLDTGSNVTPEQEIVGYTGPRRKVLIADDKEYNRLVLVNLLEPLGFEIVTAADGREMVDKAQQSRPDLILTDLIMPIMTGIEAVQAIRRIPELQHVRIIAASASVFDIDQQHSKLAGCDGFLPKPINAQHLFDLVQQQLQLEWTYTMRERQERETSSPDSSADVVTPPAEELQALFELAQRGNLRKIGARAAELERLNPAYKPFTDKLQQLAREYEEEAIRLLLQDYIGDHP